MLIFLPDLPTIFHNRLGLELIIFFHLDLYFLQRKLSVGSNSGAETTLDASTVETDKAEKKKKKKRKKDDEAADAVDTTLGATEEQPEEETDKKEKKKKKKKDKDKSVVDE